MKIIKLKNKTIKIKTCNDCPFCWSNKETQKKIGCPGAALFWNSENCPLRDKPPDVVHDAHGLDGRFGPG